MSPPKFRVLLTNDDGPPGRDSPYIYGLYKHLTTDLGWDVKVVIPSSQKSWIGKAYQIKDIIHGRYYYPRDPDGMGEVSETSRPLKEGELAEWILLDGTPATCANIGIHNLYPGQIDLLLSGPNLGRNTSSAFALSSGTIGAALSSSISKFRSIALSYGTVSHPVPTSYFLPAHSLAARIIHHLYDNWGSDSAGIRSGEVDLYSVNIPMIEGLLSQEGLPIAWTRIWRNSYGQLFKPHAHPGKKEGAKEEMSGAGPDGVGAVATPKTEEKPSVRESEGEKVGSLVFKFAPDISHVIKPEKKDLSIGSDGWALDQGWVSVTPLRASFAEPPSEELFAGGVEGQLWKMNL